MKPTKEQREERERLAESGLKQCSVRSGCGEIKTIDEFGPNKGKWDNKRTICRICARKRSNQYNKENREAKRAYSRQHYLDNLDARREYGRTYGPKYRAKKQQEDPLHYRLNEGKARAKKAGVEWENISSTELLYHWKQNNISIDTCHYCKQNIDEGELEIDHGIPIRRGGSHTLDNLFPCHKRCNRQKKDRTAEEYLEHLMQVV